MTTDPNLLTTLSDLKAWLGLSASGDDTLLTALISAASYDFLGRVARPSLSQEQAFVDRYDGTGGSRIVLRNYPVVAVSAVQIGPLAVPQSPDHITDGWVSDQYGISLVGEAWRFWHGALNVQVSYSAGYTTAPADVQQAVKVMCATWYRRRSHLDQDSQTLEGQAIKFAACDIPPEVQAVVERYRRRIPA